MQPPDVVFIASGKVWLLTLLGDDCEWRTVTKRGHVGAPIFENLADFCWWFRTVHYKNILGWSIRNGETVSKVRGKSFEQLVQEWRM
jgi:hypothetical protein